MIQIKVKTLSFSVVLLIIHYGKIKVSSWDFMKEIRGITCVSRISCKFILVNQISDFVCDHKLRSSTKCLRNGTYFEIAHMHFE